jgi:hypothetical protein
MRPHHLSLAFLASRLFLVLLQILALSSLPPDSPFSYKVNHAILLQQW